MKRTALGLLVAAFVIVPTEQKDPLSSGSVHIEPHVDTNSVIRRQSAIATPNLVRREGESLEEAGAAAASAARSAAKSNTASDPESSADEDYKKSKAVSGYNVVGSQDTNGDEGDAGLDAAGDEGTPDADDATASISKDKYLLWQNNDTHMIVRWLEWGCPSSFSADQTAFDAHTRFEKPDQRLGRVQCCRTSNSSDGASCVRRDANGTGECFGGGELHTFMEARNLCNAAGMRLCSRQELETEDALGCCKSGCGMEQELVWTSTHDFTSVRKNNEELKVEIERLESENSKLKAGHEKMREEYRLLVEKIQAYRNLHPTPPPFHGPPPTTTTLFGLSAEDLEELKKSADLVRESHEELSQEAEEMKAEWSGIMSHSPETDLPASEEVVRQKTATHVDSDEKPVDTHADATTN
mmetsp:Transcript_82997/g.173764  ORF Transcript_82997/g.173764 Transcript_82997/m.173764 type:complete len:412 (+) Transcript_82997:244-1479(+)|eukprot:CAMPEP_0206486954 /NCGR_PEP_ID=MMETSP0324_2-20121206/41328_1 /ASSEMBLY_ACC=CAM_ASM_000836 /TAXON_ID=2866 /ORGANISM="Crypthecodinium cohnii, Strain Seligo" /LENGTH=411 /DNA_ID=CAMNT_0053965293 /DNA_START=223 /DNA_END=1458 /DNA_ORIENTATION=-